ncbi:hypothetical protein TYRP_011222 [Tyrophagus putrescentiae]|nr:hypothetical protein TYRP_011222 [Tyrophagus putrescentiae]
MKHFITITTLMAAVLFGAVHSASIAPTTSSSSPTLTTTHVPSTTFHPKTTVTSTTESPRWTTKAPIRDEKLSELSGAVNALLLNATAALHDQLELAGSVGDEAALRQLTAAIKRTETAAVRLSVQIKQELLANHLNADLLFSRRLALGLLELQAKEAGRVLAEMGELALGILGGLARWPAFELSERLGSANTVINSRLTVAVVAMAEVDIALAGQLSDLKVVNASARAKVDGSLQRMATTVEDLRLEANKDLAEEVARLRVEGKAVNLWQRFQFELMIDGFTYMVAYTRNFKELFDRVNGGGGK